LLPPRREESLKENKISSFGIQNVGRDSRI
jgi:hypothetical protein